MMFLIKKYNVPTIVLGILVALYSMFFLINNKRDENNESFSCTVLPEQLYLQYVKLLNIIDMTKFMSIEQIINAAKNDIDRHIKNDSFVKQGETLIDEAGDENVYTIISTYAQWAERENEAELAIWAMMEEDYPEYLDLESLAG